MIYISLQFSQSRDGSTSPFFRKSLLKVPYGTVWMEGAEVGVAGLSQLAFPFLLPYLSPSE
jgi:hypothetical protein